MRRVSSPLALAGVLAAFAGAPAAAGDLHATYITPADIHLERLLPPPPAPGSAAARADLAAVEAAVAARTRADVARIVAEKPCSPEAFARGILGPGFSAETAPLTTALVEHAFEDTELAVLAAKATIDRARPYALDPRLATYGRRSPSASYPSGHAACGRVMAIVLTALVPTKRRALFARADTYGRNREIAGTHFPSDLVAGATAGSVVAAALFADARFRADLARAKTEMRALSR